MIHKLSHTAPARTAGPAARPAGDPSVERAALAAVPHGSEASPNRLLVVEDNPVTRRMLRVALELGGYDVVDVADGRGALASAAIRAPDLVVLDFVLPDTDGLELLSELRRTLGAAVPAVVVTGLTSRLEDLSLRTPGPTHFLAKPVEPSNLIAVVRAELARRRATTGGPRLLVVEDDVRNRKLTSVRMERAGYEVETVSGGEEALAVARRSPPDAILADVLMPTVDGFSLCREVRRDPTLAAVPIILISSAYLDEADRILAHQMGASALVARTPDLADAVAAIGAALQAESVAPAGASDEIVARLHRERLQVQLERQSARNDVLLRQAGIQAAALSLIRGLSDVLTQPRDAPQILGDVLAHCLDAAGLSTGLLYGPADDGGNRLQTQFGLEVARRPDAETAFGHPGLLRATTEGAVPVAFSAGADDLPAERRDFADRLGHSSVLILPFVVLGKDYGALVLASDSHDLTASAWIGFAQSLALQFGQAVAFSHSLRRLAESEARYRALLEQATDAICVLDPGGTILEANRQSETLLGLPRDRIVGRHISSFSPPAAEPHTHEADFAATVAAGGGRVDGVVLRRGDDTLVEVDFALSRNEIDGQVSVLSIGRDVTQRNRDAATLREAQVRLAHVVTSSPSVLYTLRYRGDELVLLWISGNVERMLGYTPDEALVDGWWEVNLHPDDRPRVFVELATLPADGFLTQEYRFRHEDGTYRWVRAEMRLSRDGVDAPAEVIGSWSDVTARRDAELKLRESEHEYRMLFDGNPHAMWVYEKDTLACRAVNEAAIRHYGYTRDEFLAMTAFDLRPADEEGAFRRAFTDSQLGDASPSYASDRPVKHRRKDGTLIEVDIAATTIGFAGQPAWLLQATDVTEKQALHVQLLEAQKMEAVGQLAGGIAHDFNNLLGVIRGYSDLLVRDLEPHSREARKAAEIGGAADRAAALTRQLLAFSRRQVLQPRVLDLNDVVADVEKMLQRLISANIQIVTVSGSGLGCVRADAGQVEQVLVNLAINSRDAMPGGGRLIIETSNADCDEAYVRSNPGARIGRSVVLAVTDDGHGMSPETMGHIFEPFFTTKEDGKGTGLGLATVYGIARQSGGTVRVVSQVGRGTTFSVYLPRVEDPLPVEASTTPAPPPGGTETILVVEDAEALRALVREMLEDGGYTVRDADSPDAALALLQSTPDPIHLILTDMVMPRMNGPELARRVASARPDTRVVFMSGYADESIAEEATLPPEVPFLQKPFTMDALLTILRRALDAPVEPRAGPAPLTHHELTAGRHA